MYLPYGQCMANYLEVIRKPYIHCMLSPIPIYAIPPKIQMDFLNLKMETVSIDTCIYNVNESSGGV